jgi:5-methylthioadenosine/S-adenosylhomocysteine deaminase
MRASLRPAVTKCLTLLTLSLLPGHGFAQQLWALRGTVVTPDGPLPRATVLIDGATIRAVGAHLTLPQGTRIVETEGFIYPGLIDLHNHVTWNVFPRWSAGAKSGARYDWQQLPEYQMALSLPHAKLVAEGHGCAAERYAEVKAILGGATAQAGLSPDDLTTPGAAIDPATPPANCLGHLVRELGVASRLYPNGTPESLHYEVFPLALDPSHTAALIAGLHSGTVRSALLHLAEGGATNAGARREFGFLQARGLLTPGVSIIHGVALTPGNFADMAKSGVGLVWSPHSNFELYGSTADIAAAKHAGVTLALAPDWSPTGSDGMLQELKYAAIWNATQYPAPFTDRDLFDMATRNAAALAGIADQTGSIAAGKRADLLVLAAPQADPYDELVHASAAAVALVVVDGSPLYGDPSLMHQARGMSPSTVLNICGATKELALATPEIWPATLAELTTGLNRWGTALALLPDCR